METFFAILSIVVAIFSIIGLLVVLAEIACIILVVFYTIVDFVNRIKEWFF